MKTQYGEIAELPDTPQIQGLLKEPLSRELLFFRYCDKFTGYEGEGRAFHGMAAADLLWRKKGEEQFEWHPWLVTAFKEYCETDEVLVTGPASGGKTFGAALYAVLFWLCAPHETGVLLCSTTLDGLKRRIWGEIRKLFMSARKTFRTGNLVDSKTAIQSTKGDAKLGLFGLAVAAGEEQKALGRIIGFHPKRILVIVDELTDVGWSIVEAATNLFTAKARAQFIGIGNALSHFDSHGKMSEPLDGWDSVSVENEKWKTKRGGVCLHFDGFKSPNILEGKPRYRFLMTQADITKTANEHGENSPQMWRMRRGFWCPEGTVRSVLTESIIQKFRAMEKAQWRGEYTVGAALDPAFEGGDRCVLRKVKWGEGEGGLETMELCEIYIIKVSLVSPEPIHYQIARAVKSKCIEWGVEARNFGMDSTGEGGGLASIIATEWSPDFLQVEFGGRASENPVSKINSKRCCDEYFNKVTEIWFGFRTALINGQIRGLDADTAIEFCSRIYTVEAKIRMESKTDMKKRANGKSPDFADDAAIACALVLARGGLGMKNSPLNRDMERSWDKLVSEFSVVEDGAYTHEAIGNL